MTPVAMPATSLFQDNSQGSLFMTLAAILKYKGRSVISVLPDTEISDVVTVLSEKRIGAVVVIDAFDRLIGILSERDIVRSLASNGSRIFEMTAAQLMTRSPTVTSSDITVVEAMEIMTNGRFRHLPVVDGGKLAGMISIGDVVKARIAQQGHEVDSLRAYVVGMV